MEAHRSHHEHHNEDSDTKNGWNSAKEEYLKRIANRNGALVWMHNSSSKFYSNADKVWSIIIACCFIVFGAGGIPGTVNIGGNTTSTNEGIGSNSIANLSLALGILTIIFGILSVVQVIVGLDAISSSHSDAATRNTELYLGILKELRVENVRLRIRGDRFVHMVVEQQSRNNAQAPSIPTFQVRKYFRYFGQKAIPYEELFGEDELLRIDDNLRHMREHEASVVSLVLAESRKNTNNVETHLDEDSLDDKLRVHGKGQKIRRAVPTLDSTQLADLEKYLNSD